MNGEILGENREKRFRSVTELVLPAEARLLMLAPHPDDFDAIAVTLRFLAGRGNPLEVVVLRTGSGVEDGYRSGLTITGKAELREQEQRASLRFFGLPDRSLTFLNLSADIDDQPVDCTENRAAIRRILREKAPDLVFLPHGNDTNSGHRVLYALFAQAAACAGRPMSAFLNRDAKTISMRTDFYMPFGAAPAAWKAELLRFHDSQHQRNLRTRGQGFDERVLHVNRHSARELHLEEEYAEAFEVESWPRPPARKKT